MRWIIRLAVVLVLVVLVAVGMLFMLPSEKIGQIASDQLEKATGRKLSLSGDFSPTFYPVLGVKTGPITISNADWAENAVMVSASGVSVGVGMKALFGGNLEITRLRLVDPVIQLEKARDGRVNWEFGGTSGVTTPANDGGDSGPTISDFSLALGEITNGTLQYLDHASGEVVEISRVFTTVSLPKGSAGLTASGSGEWQGKKAEFAVDLANMDSFLASKSTALTARGSFDGVEFDWAGMVGLGQDIPTLDGTLGLRSADLSQFGDLLAGLPAPVQKARDLDVKGDLQLSGAGMYFNGKAAIKVGEQPVQSDIELTGEGDWQQNLAFDVAANLRAGQALDLTFEGQVTGSTGMVRGKLNMKSNAPRRLLAMADISADLPKGTFNALAVRGNLRVAPDGSVTLKKARITVDQNTVNGRVTLTTKGKPLLTANLNAKALDFAAFTSDQGAGGAGSSETGTTGWSKEPISLTDLDAINADVVLKAQSVNLGVSKLGLTHIKAKLRKGVLSLKLVDVRAFQGAMSGSIRLRGGKGIGFDSDVLAKNMQLKPLLGQLLGIDRLIGTGTTRLKLSGQGASLDQLMNSLSGTGDIKFADGAFRGIDLAAMMRNLKSAFGGFEGATEFTSMTGSFTLVKGVLENVDLSLISPLFKAVGKGKVGIGGQFMDYVITPSTLKGDAKISVPVTITGPWDNLKFRPDLDKLIDLVLQGKLKDNAEVQKARKKLEKARAKLRDPKKLAKEELRKKVAKELGSDVATEEAIKQKLENKIEQELGNALRKLLE